jgi:hypothetical protein
MKAGVLGQVRRDGLSKLSFWRGSGGVIHCALLSGGLVGGAGERASGGIRSSDPRA